ncbi:LytR/AlgR family response regulator transcription factor [Hymenobacter convexus]|uniref:LytR/AlgR family response regulator transcription factor n=1 Tax=Hymenobacter sp. CA1UV-4 TaxID=3063782 RepID=UPI002713D5D3|nr:LytTR family DNA-binding domain-containing protein [Hymenobacter sp. CA1UV-4]MDO7852052.1 LytTR family DNA-binding domain-containing protein [Hymenobacter sp. CA1UV-4]
MPSRTAPFTCLVLDDDLLVRDLAGSFVERIPSLVLAGAYDDALLAFERLAREPVDILITDIELPQLNGLELVRALRQPPQVIFMTSHPEYALPTYELDAVDFLVKPLRFDRFLRAIDKALLLLRARAAEAAPVLPSAGSPPEPTDEPDTFFIRTEFQFLKLRFAEVAYVEAMRDFVKVHLLDGTVHITLVNLKHMEEQLPPALFVRTHRSFLVNTSHIDAVTNQEVRIGKVEVPLGSTFREAVLAQVVQQRLLSRHPSRRA